MKKLSLWLVVLSMLMTLLPGTMVSAANEWLDIEVEDGTPQDSELLLSRTDNDRKYMYTIQGTSSAHKVTNSFSIENAGEYDIWAAVGKHTAGQYLSSYIFTLDEATYDTISAQSSATETESLYVTSQAVAQGYNMTMMWVKVQGNVELSAAEHSLTTEIAGGTSATGNKFGAVDVVRIVPSDWNWKPDASFDDPERVELEPEIDYDDPEWEGIIHLEAEDGEIGGGAKIVEEDAASGGKYVARTGTGGTPGGSVVAFETDEECTYDIWAAIAGTDISNYGSTDAEFVGGYKFELDEEAIYTKAIRDVDQGYNDLYGKTIVMIPGVDNTVTTKSTATVSWVKIAEAKTIGKGEHTLKLYTNTNVHNTGIIDCVRLIPTGYTWEAKDFTTAPVPGTPGGDTGDGGDDDQIANVPDEDGIIDIEAESGVLSGSMQVYELAAASGGKYTMSCNTGKLGSTKVAFKTTEKTAYDIWAAVAVPSTTGTHLGGYSFILDDDDVAMYEKNHSATDRTHPDMYDGINLYSTNTSAGGASTVKWIKVTSGKTIDAGEHTITAGVIAGVPANSTGAIDCIRLIPTGMEWDATELPDVTTARLLAEDIKKTYFAGDYSAVTEDITLPEDIELPKNASVAYDSDKPELIASDGSVTRPYFNAEDATVNFYICATCNDKTVKLPVEMKVLKNSKYTVTEFAASEELEANEWFAAFASIDLNAAADSGVSGKCALVAALYNADGSLAAITMDGATVTPDGAELGVELQLPVDVSGCYMKVYVLNGLEMANQLAEVITVR